MPHPSPPLRRGRPTEPGPPPVPAEAHVPLPIHLYRPAPAVPLVHPPFPASAYNKDRTVPTALSPQPTSSPRPRARSNSRAATARLAASPVADWLGSTPSPSPAVLHRASSLSDRARLTSPCAETSTPRSLRSRARPSTANKALTARTFPSPPASPAPRPIATDAAVHRSPLAREATSPGGAHTRTKLLPAVSLSLDSPPKPHRAASGRRAARHEPSDSEASESFSEFEERFRNILSGHGSDDDGEGEDMAEVALLRLREKLIHSLPSSPESRLAGRASSRTPTPAAASAPSAPARPRRSSFRETKPSASAMTGELRPPFAAHRAVSPAGSESTITAINGRSCSPAQMLGPLNGGAQAMPHSEPMRKRDSTQRRLSALKGLVASLDFNNPWIASSVAEGDQEEGYVWACHGPAPLSADSDKRSAPPPETSAVPELGTRSSLSMSSTASETDDSIRSPMLVSGPVPLHVDPHAARDEQAWMSPCRKSSVGGSDFPFPRVTSPTRSPSRPSPKRYTSTPTRKARRDIFTPEPPRPSKQRTETFDVASSGYSKSLEPASPTLPVGADTWRAAAGEEASARAVAMHGPLEVKRQEVMWELCETETAFVKSARTVLRLFATPLRTPQGNWISGIPPQVTDLFDTLEAIGRAHAALEAAQRDARRRSPYLTLDVGAFVACLKVWVGRLEVHEDYLIRFEPVVQLVEDNVRDADSVFGEFVRMQMKDEALGSMSLGSMLLKPVQRLTKYPLFFKRLLDATPTAHASHPDVLSLLASTESIILTLQASKAREEDFEQLRSLEARLHGLPDGFTLAVRGRKLLGTGTVQRLPHSKDASPSLRTRASSVSSRNSFSSSASSSQSPWEYTPGLTPTTCRTSAFSVSSGASSSCGPPSRSNSLVHSPSSAASPRSIARSPSATSSLSLAEHARPSTPNTLRRRAAEPLTMFVFDDVAVVGSGMAEKGGLFTKGKKDRLGSGWRVLPELEGGIGKVVQARDWSGWGGQNNLFGLTLETPSGHMTTTAYTVSPATASGSPKRPASIVGTGAALSTMPQFMHALAAATAAGGPAWAKAGEDGTGVEMLCGDAI